MKRALTPARTPGPMLTAGDPDRAAALSRALDISRVNEDGVRALTHGFHTYPARMHPHTARRVLAALGVEPGDHVLDPFCGSGTVLVETIRLGAHAIGRDASPLAGLISRARTWPGTAERRKLIVAKAREIAGRVDAEGKAARRADYDPPPLRGSKGRGEKLAGWFDPHVRREVEALAAAVDEVRDASLRDILVAILSSILVKVSRRQSDTRAEKQDRKIGRGFPARIFADRAEELSRGLDSLWKGAPPKTPPAEIALGDARKLEGLATGSVEWVLTSPPYAGTYDYHDHHSLRLAFLGLPDAGFATSEIGARRGFKGNVEGALSMWDRDLTKVLAEIARVLRPGGAAVFLIGDSLAGAPPLGKAVFGDEVLTRLAPAAGLTWTATASIRRTPLGAAEIGAFRARAKHEHLVWFEKSATAPVVVAPPPATPAAPPPRPAFRPPMKRRPRKP